MLPPGPRMPAALQTLAYATRPVSFMRRCQRRYGDVFTLRMAPYGQMVWVCAPELVREVFAGSPAVFHVGAVRSVLAPALGEHSLLLLDEDEHLRERRLMLPPFHGEALAGYRALIAEIAREDLERWPIGEPFAVLPRMRAVTLEVILRVVIGTRDPDRLAALREALQRLLSVNLTFLFFVSMLQREPSWLPWWRRFIELRTHVHALLEEEIRRRRASPTGEDVLSLLVSASGEDGDKLSDGELRDELVTLLLAGHETTATALAWALERLVRHPHEIDQLRNDGDARMEAVIKETLRVRPVINEVGRDLVHPVEIGGYHLPAGTRVMCSLGAVHRDDRNHLEPAAFQPQRFLDDAQPPPYVWIPFGGGVRRCLGASFAMLEMSIVLRAILDRFDLAPARPEPERPELRAVTFVPSRGGEIVAEPRVEGPRPRRLRHAAAPALGA